MRYFVHILFYFGDSDSSHSSVHMLVTTVSLAHSALRMLFLGSTRDKVNRDMSFDIWDQGIEGRIGRDNHILYILDALLKGCLCVLFEFANN